MPFKLPYYLSSLNVILLLINCMLIKNGKKLRVGFTCSAFDLCHAGHISMLEEAKNQCDWLIVGLQNDLTADRPSKNKPVQSIVERFIQLNAVKYVDQIIPYNTEKDLEDLLLMLPIDIRILGDEYKDKEFTGKSICIKRGIEIYFNGREHSFSTTDLRRRVTQADLNKLSPKERYDLLSNDIDMSSSCNTTDSVGCSGV